MAPVWKQANIAIIDFSRNVTTTASGDSLYEFGTKHITKGLGRMTEGIMVKGSGSYVTYDNGQTFLDFTCGIGVTNLGTPSKGLEGRRADAFWM